MAGKKQQGRNRREAEALATMDDLSDDELEKFHDDRLRDDNGLKLSEERTRQGTFMKLDAGDSDEEDDDSEEEVLGIGSEDSDVDVSDSEEEDAEKLEIEKIGKKWGTKRSDYFKEGEESGSEGDEDEEDDDMEEEKEAKRMKKQLLANLRNEDFEIGSDDEEEAAKRKSLAKKKKKSSKNEELERVIAQAPELLSLLSEFKSNLAVLEGTIAPVLEKVKGDLVPTDDGISYLEAKFQAMLTYCINVAFYLYLKSHGQSVRDHPVISELVRIRVMLEKLKPLDAKLKNQIDDILAVAAGRIEPKSRGSGKAKPNVKDLVADDDGSLDEDSEEEDDDDEGSEEEEDVVISKKEKKGSSKFAGKYMAPKEMVVGHNFEQEEKEEEKFRKKQSKLKAKLKKNVLLQEITNEFSDRPTEMPSIGAAMEDPENRRKQAERQKYEDEYFVRLRETKKERAERRRREKDAEMGLSRSLEEIQEFGDLEGILNRVQTDASFHHNEKHKRQEDLERYLNKGRHSKQKKERNDDEIRIRDPEIIQTRREREPREDPEEEERKKKRKMDKMRKKIDETTEVDINMEDDFYRDAAQLEVAQKKIETRRNTVPDLLQSEPTQFIGKDENRKASRTILKNQGLHAHKKKEDRNPRVRRRMQYEKKMKARKGQVISMRSDEADNYQGEATGLRTNLVASRRPGR